MKRALHIGLMTPAWPGTATPNGIATAVYHLACGLHDIGHHPVILTERIDGPTPEAAGALPVLEIKRHWRLIDKLRARFDPENAVHRVMENAIVTTAEKARAAHGLDVLIVEESFGRGAAVNAALEIPVVAALHGPWALLSETFPPPLTATDRYRIAREEQSFGGMAGLLAPSASAMEIARQAPGTDPLPQAVIPNPIPSGARLDSAVEDLPHILFVGRFDTVKGGDTVLAAFAQLHKTHPDARLTFVGPDRGCNRPNGGVQKIDEALAELPGATRAAITYTGPLPRPEIEELRRRHPIALLASRYEVFAYTMAEAMAAGQALVCTNVGGPREYQTDGETALLVSADDADTMAKALARLLDTPDLRRSLIANGHSLLGARFAPQAVARETVDFLAEVLKRHESP